MHTIMVCIVLFSLTATQSLWAQEVQDTAKAELKFPLQDQQYIEDEFNSKKTIDLKDPENIQKEVEYDPESKEFNFNRKVGNRNIKNPTSLSADEYLRQRSQTDENAYWQQRLNALSMFNQKPTLPAFSRTGLFDRLFGGTSLIIKPQGNIDLSFFGNWTNTQNFNLPEKSRKYGIFDFDMVMNIKLLAQIGEKMKLDISQNTLSNAADQNMQKIEYSGNEDEIIKKIEAGRVSFPLKSSLVPGVQSLMGLKAQLQFGKLWLTGVISNQESQRRSVTIQGGGQYQTFEIKADEYEENRNFLLGQFFYEQYDKALVNFPIINSQVQITEMEVWVTNRTGATEGIRDVLAFTDLGESKPYNNTYIDPAANFLPDNNANRLYKTIQQNPGLRLQSTATQAALGLGLKDEIDFQRTTMRKLNPGEFTIQPQLGYISLNTYLNTDDVLAVSYRYTYNGNIYQVGEMSSEISPDPAAQKVIFLKMIKGISNKPNYPIWNLMMKNIYSLGSMNIAKDDFKLDVFYQDPGGGEKRYLPEGRNSGEPLISVLNLDRLNFQNDPMPDGIFDFVENITINVSQGKVIFPMLKPFGEDLKPVFNGDPILERKYLYNILYDSTKIVAQQFQQNNRYIIKGTYSSSSGTDIYLGGFNIPQGSVTVTAGGSRLAENVDYQVDYSMGRVNIINPGVLASGVPINISYEDNSAFSMNSQAFKGIRADYYANEKLSIGATYMQLSEKPMVKKVNYGEDPINNKVIGLDVNYQSESEFITRLVDKLPLYSTVVPSLVSITGEVAGIFPGHHKLSNLGIDEGGTNYLDDFEGANSSIDLRSPATMWSLASTPVEAKNATGNILFPEATLINDLKSGYNRARLAWYNLETQIVEYDQPPGVKGDQTLQDYWRLIQSHEVFDKEVPTYQQSIATFDLAYYPTERGPYNFDAQNIDPNTGHLLNPQDRFGGIMRSIDINSDFEANNIEYITFWVLDPYIYDPGSLGGDLYFNLGSVSEDVLKDSRLSFENGITYPKDLNKLDSTPWGFVPKFQQQVTRAFSNDPLERAVQDVGFDGLDDKEESEVFRDYLNQISNVIVNPDVLQKIMDDPANDNFHSYRGSDYDQAGLTALQRYKLFNNPQGNTPVNTNNQEGFGSTGLPESEDLNRDNTLNETEAYYQYRVRIEPNMEVGQNYIVDKRMVDVDLMNGTKSTNTWYQFKIPIRAYDHVVGGIGDFRSIRYMRMFLSGFQDSMVILRFAQLQLDRNQWRRYQYSLSSPGENIPEEDQLRTSYALTSVSLEQNADKKPVGYQSPPGIQQEQQRISSGQNINLDEQALSLQLCGLKDGDSRAIFRNFGNRDLRQFDRLKMFIHAESVIGNPSLKNGDVYAFVRIGSDFINNYYEYRLPMYIDDNAVTKETVWPVENRLDIILEDLVKTKAERNEENLPSYIPYIKKDRLGNDIIVVGNPNLGEVKNIMMGVLNPQKTLNTPDDDGLDKCAEVWFNELRLSGLNEKPAYAASGSIAMQIADLGSINLSASMYTDGYGSIDQGVNERAKENFYQYSGSANLQMGKLLPKKWGVTLPVYVGYSQNSSNPRFDPYDKDIKLTDKLDYVDDRAKALKDAQTFSSVTSLNLSNVKINGNVEKQRPQAYPWSARNFDLNYSYNRAFSRNPLVESDEFIQQKLGVGYTYNIRTKYIEPFKKRIKSPARWWTPIKDLNINLLPSNFTFRTNLDRDFGETIVRNIDDGPYQIPATYFKNFYWTRNYNLRWELTRSLMLNYSAMNESRIDEPQGRLDTREKRDSVWKNISRFGRNTFFHQEVKATYVMPLRKIPLLDWTSLTVTYAANYDWNASSLLAKSQGNIIANTQLRQINGELNFKQLYDKSRYLKAFNQLPKSASQGDKMRSKLSSGGGVLDNLKDVGGSQLAGNNPKDLSSQLNSSREGDQGSNNKNSRGGNNTNNPNNPNNQSQEEKDKEKERKRSSTLPPKPKRKEIERNQVPGHDTLSTQVVNEAYRTLKKQERLRYRREIIAWRKRKQSIIPDVSEGARIAGKVATMLKRTTFNITENYGTVLPGYLDSTRFFGINNQSMAPGYFAFGYQPDRYWLEREAAAGRMSRDSIFNGQLRQEYRQNINVQATLEPYHDLKVDLTWTKRFSKNHSEIFKYDKGDFQHYTPQQMGSFDISYIGLTTMFTPSKANQLSDLFNNFIEYRTIISERLGRSNPYTNNTNDPNNPDYKKGYGEYSQDVLIPAFIAAYTGQNPHEVSLIDNENKSMRSNPFRGYFPMPNWKLSYTGLSKMPALRQKVTTLVIDHSYTGSMSMNSFGSNYFYQDLLGVGFPSFIDSNSYNYVPYFQVPNITISERFGPLIGINMMLNNSLSLRVQFIKGRTLSMSLIDYQISETKSSEFTMGGGFTFKGVNLPFEAFGVRRLENDLQFNFEFGIRNDITSNSYLAQKENITTRGQNVLTISPNLMYIVNDNLQIVLFFDRRQIIPATLQSFPMSNTKGGITIRYLFTDQ